MIRHFICPKSASSLVRVGETLQEWGLAHCIVAAPNQQTITDEPNRPWHIIFAHITDAFEQSINNNLFQNMACSIFWDVNLGSLELDYQTGTLERLIRLAPRLASVICTDPDMAELLSSMGAERIVECPLPYSPSCEVKLAQPDFANGFLDFSLIGGPFPRKNYFLQMLAAGRAARSLGLEARINAACDGIQLDLQVIGQLCGAKLTLANRLDQASLVGLLQNSHIGLQVSTAGRGISTVMDHFALGRPCLFRSGAVPGAPEEFGVTQPDSVDALAGKIVEAVERIKHEGDSLAERLRKTAKSYSVKSHAMAVRAFHEADRLADTTRKKQIRLSQKSLVQKPHRDDPRPSVFHVYFGSLTFAGGVHVAIERYLLPALQAAGVDCGYSKGWASFEEVWSNDYDLVHFHGCDGESRSQVALAEAISYCKKMGIPHVLTIHWLWPICRSSTFHPLRAEYCPECDPDCPARPRKELTDAFKEAQMVTVPSERAAWRIREIGGYDREIEIIPLPVDVERFRRTHREYHTHPIRVGMACSAEHVPNSKGLQDFQSLANSLGNIDFEWKLIVNTPFDEMPNEYNQLDILVTPANAEETYGLCLLEGMASGCVLISTPRGIAEEAITPWWNGFICRSTDEIRKVLSNLREEPLAVPKLGDRAGETALTQYSTAAVLPRWLQLYERVMGNATGGSNSLLVVADSPESLGPTGRAIAEAFPGRFETFFLSNEANDVQASRALADKILRRGRGYNACLTWNLTKLSTSALEIFEEWEVRKIQVLSRMPDQSVLESCLDQSKYYDNVIAFSDEVVLAANEKEIEAIKKDLIAPMAQFTKFERDFRPLKDIKNKPSVCSLGVVPTPHNYISLDNMAEEVAWTELSQTKLFIRGSGVPLNEIDIAAALSGKPCLVHANVKTASNGLWDGMHVWSNEEELKTLEAAFLAGGLPRQASRKRHLRGLKPEIFWEALGIK